MVDDIVMRARLIDDATARLQGIAMQLSRLSKQSNIKGLRGDFSELRNVLAGVGREFNVGFLPTLARTGIGVGIITAALAGAVEAFKKVGAEAKRVANMAVLRREIGLTQGTILSFSEAMRRQNVSSDQALAGLKKFAEGMAFIRRGIVNQGFAKELQDSFKGGADLVKALARTKTDEQAFSRILSTLRQLNQEGRHFEALQLAKALTGIPEMARDVDKIMAQVNDLIFKSSAAQEAAATKLTKTFADINIKITSQAQQAMAAMTPVIQKIADNLNVITSFSASKPSESMKAFAEQMQILADMIPVLSSGDWKGVDRGIAWAIKHIADVASAALGPFGSFITAMTSFKRLYDSFIGTSAPTGGAAATFNERFSASGVSGVGAAGVGAAGTTNPWAPGGVMDQALQRRVGLEVGGRQRGALQTTNDFLSGGLLGVAEARGYKPPPWMKSVADVARNPAYVDALNMAVPGMMSPGARISGTVDTAVGTATGIYNQRDSIMRLLEKLDSLRKSLTEQTKTSDEVKDELKRLNDDAEFGGRQRFGLPEGEGGGGGGGGRYYHRGPGGKFARRSGGRGGASGSAGEKEWTERAFSDNEMEAMRRGIVGIESGGGNYNAVGSVTKSGDRAWGAYQVMGNNVGPWTEKYYGKRLSPREYLKNKEAQDAVFKGEFGRLARRYGPEGAARAWYGGERGMRNLGAADMHGRLTVGSYGSTFRQTYQRQLAKLNAQNANVDPSERIGQNLGVGGGNNVKAEGTVNVNVYGPPGTRANSDNDGPLFQQSALRVIKQAPSMPYGN